MYPYIGVTGIDSFEQVHGLISSYFENECVLPDHLLMIGGLVSYKTLMGLKDDSKLLLRRDVNSIFNELLDNSREKVLFALHYSTKSFDRVKPELQPWARRVVEKSLHQQIVDIYGKLIETHESRKPSFQLGLQINVSWPDPDEFNEISKLYSKLRTVLQVSDFDSAEEKIELYNADYILIDASRGKGVEFEVEDAVRVYDSIKGKEKSSSFVFAGGLSSENVTKKVIEIREHLFSINFSIDAESRLRTDNKLDLEKTRNYLHGAVVGYIENLD